MNLNLTKQDLLYLFGYQKDINKAIKTLIANPLILLLLIFIEQKIGILSPLPILCDTLLAAAMVTYAGNSINRAKQLKINIDLGDYSLEKDTIIDKRIKGTRFVLIYERYSLPVSKKQYETAQIGTKAIIYSTCITTRFLCFRKNTTRYIFQREVNTS